ncbi:MAG: hypothetical protein BWK73_16210 [Thiothrix lacustris]|uniref:PKD domain-containing protein n=1 Tax=Thiothrix lacustris TaxID=525917 RepID=A0A1Y1QR67_9GAMM|nr:MAG: hypothetical protein BWK73_16210 [Thiothrix lacustris]
MKSIPSGWGTAQHHNLQWLMPFLLLLSLLLSGCGGGSAATPATVNNAGGTTVTPPVVTPPPAVIPAPVTPPVSPNKVPSALDASATLVDGTAGEITLVAVDLDGDAVRYVVVSQPAHGTLGSVGSDGKVKYTPTAGYVGADSFTYKVNDGKADSAVATVKLTVKAKADGGTTGSTNHAPVAVAGNLTVSNSGSDWVKLEATDADGDTLTFRIVTQPAHGTLRLGQGNVYIYTPNSSYEGDDSFTFVANDGKVDSAAATVGVRVYTNTADSGSDTAEQKISGRVLDGYLQGARVFWDCNGDLKINTDEINVTSGAGGRYQISPAPKTSCKLLADVPSTAIDEDTNQAVGGSVILAALPSNPKIITPLTTLVTVGKMTEAEVREKFKLSLLEKDYIKAGVAGISQHDAAKVTMIGLQAVDGQIRNATETERNAIVGQSLLHVFNAGYDPNSGKSLTKAQLDAIKAAIPQRSSMPQVAPVNFVLNPKTTSSFSDTQKQLIKDALDAANTYDIISGLTIRWSELPDNIRRDLGERAAKAMPVTAQIEKLRVSIRKDADTYRELIDGARKNANSEMLAFVTSRSLSITTDIAKSSLSFVPASSIVKKYEYVSWKKKTKYSPWEKITKYSQTGKKRLEQIEKVKNFLECQSLSNQGFEYLITEDSLDIKKSLDIAIQTLECLSSQMSKNGKLGVKIIGIAKNGYKLNALDGNQKDLQDLLEGTKLMAEILSAVFDAAECDKCAATVNLLGAVIDGQLAAIELDEVGNKALTTLQIQLNILGEEFNKIANEYSLLFFAARVDPYIMVDVEADFNFTNPMQSKNIQVIFTPAISDEARKKGGGTIGYEWDFGDKTGISSTSQVTHAYAKSGSYDVTFTVKSVAAGNPYSLSVTKSLQIGLSDAAIAALKMRLQYPIVIPSSKRVAAKAEGTASTTTASTIAIEPGNCYGSTDFFNGVENTLGVIPYDVKIYNKVTGRPRGGRHCLTDTSGNVNYEYNESWFSKLGEDVDLANHYMVVTAGHTDRCSGKQTTIRRDDITTDFDLGEITLCTSATTDTDTDGMPDVWELENGLDPKNPADAPQDKDGDGISNLDEFKGNTDPSRLVTPQNFRATASDGKVTLTWDKVAGATNYWVCHATETIKELSSCTYATGGTWVKPIATNNVAIPLQNGVKYYFRMLAENGEGYASAASEEATATPGKATTGATGKLNDTGITTCSNATTNGLPCPQADFPGQDAESGRDANQATNNDADGHRGFSFTKISSTGAELPASATQWSCVKDNVTGLMWEVKTDDSGLHDKDWTYSWYEPDGSKNGGNAGTQNGGSCGETSICDTSSYVQSVNAHGWCGANDWRMPTVDELSGIATLDRVDPAIDTRYFPNVPSTTIPPSVFLWSSSPLVAYDSKVRGISLGGFYLYDGSNSSTSKYNQHHVWLVRSGQ